MKSRKIRGRSKMGGSSHLPQLLSEEEGEEEDGRGGTWKRRRRKKKDLEILIGLLILFSAISQGKQIFLHSFVNIDYIFIKKDKIHTLT